jgi:hypothetical protein
VQPVFISSPLPSAVTGLSFLPIVSLPRERASERETKRERERERKREGGREGGSERERKGK